MRIAVVHNLPPGGARRRLASQMRCFQHSVVEVCLETAAPIRSDATIVPLEPLAARLPRALRPPLRYVDMLGLERAWRRAAHLVDAAEVDAIYLNPCQFLQAPPIPLHRMAPAVYFCDEARRVDLETAGNRSRNRLTVPVYRALYARQRHLDRATAAGVRAIATNSRHSAAEIERAYGRRSTVVRMGVAPTLRSRRPSRPGDFILSVGALVRTKGHDLVLRAAAACPTPPPVQIVTPRPAADEAARLSVLARELGVDLRLHVGISDQALGELYAAARTTVYLARAEPFGLASIEAQAQGCPVIVSAEGGLPETIIESETGWSVPPDPATVADKIGLLADPQLRERMSRAARAHAASWTWETSSAQIEELLSRAATGSQVRSSARHLPTR